MQLYNTLTRSKEEFQPIKKDEVKLYTCGPTVYHYAHIGNLKNVIFNDTLRRTIELSSFRVKHVMNITDVGHLTSDGDEGEDKLEKGAKAAGKTVWEAAKFYTDAFNRHAAALNVLPPTRVVKATDTIQAQINLVKTLLDKDYAYLTSQAIYFDVTKLDDYGKLSGQNLKDKEVGVRREVVTDPQKHNPHDFALWFFTMGHFADHTMRWPSPWGEGFPGWHLECSAIIHQELGEPIDIHTGGVDHIGTHHTNEIAQSEAAFEKPLAQFWLHNEFLLFNDGKMAKSDGNTLNLDELIKKGYDPLAFRLLILQSHYRSQQNFTWEALDAAAARLKNLQAWADLKLQIHEDPTDIQLVENLRTAQAGIEEALKDDLDTPKAIAILNKLVDGMNLISARPKERKEFQDFLRFIDRCFGLNLSNRADISSGQREILDQRQNSRDVKDYSNSDKLRSQLLNQGLEIEDTPRGQRWRRV